MMKCLIVLFAFVAVGFCAPICFPAAFTTHEVTFQPERQDVFIAQQFFSYAYQKYRVDFDIEIIDGKYTKAKRQFLFDYPRKVWYDINLNQGHENCTKNPLTGSLQQPCLSKNAKHRGRFVLGGVLEIENYVETFRTDNGTERVRLDIAFAENINVPIRVVDHAHGVEKRFAIIEYWNFKESVHHDMFIVPQVCQSGDQEITMQQALIGGDSRFSRSLISN